MTSVQRVGTVTLLFTDLVGSTELLEALGDDEADELRRTHFRLLRRAVRHLGGEEVKNLGDGLMAVFPSAVDALACAVQMQQAVDAHNRSSPGHTFQVRIGLHGGDALREGNDYFGRPVVVAKRLCDSALGGQILASELVENLAGSRGGFEFRDLGWIALKGIATPVPAREVLWAPSDDDGSGAGLPEEDSEDPLAVERSRRSRARLLAAGGALIVAGIGVAAWVALSPGDGTLPRAGSQEPAEERQEVVGEQANEEPSWEALEDLSWRRIHDQAIFNVEGEQRIMRLTSSRTGLVGVGWDLSFGDFGAAVWTSVDGTNWQRAASSSVLDGDGDETMWGVKSYRGTLIAVGRDGSGGKVDAAIWRSKGVSWSRVPDPEGFFGGPGVQAMNRVVPGGLGIVALGYEEIAGDRDAAVWTSSGGRNWVREAHVEKDFGGPADQEMRSVIPLPRNRLVAVGYSGPEGDRDAAVWFCDGRRWKRVRHDKSVFGGKLDQEMTTVTDRDGLLVAVGTDGTIENGDAAVWTSRNGKVWTRVEHDEDVFGGPGDQTIHGVEGFDLGFVAVGREDSGEDIDAVIWVSPNGFDWRRMPLDRSVFGGPGDQEAKWLVGTDKRLVLVGWDSAGGDLDAAVWTAKLD